MYRNMEMQSKRKKKDDKEMFRDISDAINNLACAIREPRKHDRITIFVRQPEPAKPRVRFEFGIGVPQAKEKEGTVPVSVKISNEQKVKVTLTPRTDTGKPAKLDGVPTWEVISGSSTVVAAVDGLSADLISADDPGDTEILVKADADLGEGVETISDVIQLSVVGATAKNLGLAVGTPEPKPEAPPV